MPSNNATQLTGVVGIYEISSHQWKRQLYPPGTLSPPSTGCLLWLQPTHPSLVMTNSDPVHPTTALLAIDKLEPEYPIAQTTVWLAQDSVLEV